MKVALNCSERQSYAVAEVGGAQLSKYSESAGHMDTNRVVAVIPNSAGGGTAQPWLYPLAPLFPLATTTVTPIRTSYINTLSAASTKPAPRIVSESYEICDGR